MGSLWFATNPPPVARTWPGPASVSPRCRDQQGCTSLLEAPQLLQECPFPGAGETQAGGRLCFPDRRLPGATEGPGARPPPRRALPEPLSHEGLSLHREPPARPSAGLSVSSALGTHSDFWNPMSVLSPAVASAVESTLLDSL